MKNNYPLVTIIIDNWNGKHFLKRCLDSIFSQKYPVYEVVLIDDASSDGSVKFIKENYPKVRLIENKNHVGFAIANNQGIKIARGKYILLLNNDTKVTEDFLFPLVEDLEEDETLGAVQSKIKVMNDPIKLDDVASYLTPFGILYHLGFFEKDEKKFNKKYLTFSPKGACFFVRKKVLDVVGLFDDRFYCYFEESDLAWRIWLSGLKIIFEPRSIIYHVVAGTMKKQTSANRDYLAVRNRLNSLITNLSIFSLIIILPLHSLVLFGLIIFYLFKRKWFNIVAIIKAVLWNLSHLGQTLNKRVLVQKKIRRISDFELFRLIFKIPSIDYYLRFFQIYQKAG